MAFDWKEVFARSTMRVLNIVAICLIIGSWVARFTYWKAYEVVVEVTREQTDAGGQMQSVSDFEVKTEREPFIYALFTLFVFPGAVFVLFTTELQVQKWSLDVVSRSFYFLDYHAGKAFLLTLVATLILQHTDVLQVLAALVIYAIALINLAHCVLFGSAPISSQRSSSEFGAGGQLKDAQTDQEVLACLEKAQAARKKDPKKVADGIKSLARAKKRMDGDGQQKVLEMSIKSNSDGRSGSGTMHVVYLNSASKKTATKARGKTDVSADSARNTSERQQMLNSQPPKRLSKTTTDGPMMTAVKNIPTNPNETSLLKSHPDEQSSLKGSPEFERDLEANLQDLEMSQSAQKQQRQSNMRGTRARNTRQRVHFVDSEISPAGQASKEVERAHAHY